GHRVVTFTPERPIAESWLGSELTARGFEWVPVARYKSYDPREIVELIRLFNRHEIDVVHSHEFAPTVFGSLACWLTRRNHVATMHSSLYFATAWRRRRLFRWAVRHSAGVVAVSRDTQADAERILRLPPGTIHVIANGIAVQPGDRMAVRR